jgi:hypothetical protein
MSRDADALAAYEEWNRRLAERFYSKASAHRLAYLDVSEERLAELVPEGVSASEAAAHLTRSVLQTVYQAHTEQRLFAAHLLRLYEWRLEQSRDQVPPCIALLALLVLVAEQMAADPRFGSNNYYGRLADRLCVRAEDQEALTRAFRAHTPAMWHALNEWLESWHGERGLPTAFAFDHRRFVGLPISQALMRESDRARLPDCFNAYGLRGGQSIAAADMQRLLGAWILDAPVTQRLKSQWRHAEVRERIAEIACLELEAWNEAQSPTAMEAAAPLLLTALVHHAPRLRVQLALVTRESADVVPGAYRLLRSHDEGSVPSASLGNATLAPAACNGYHLLRAQGALSQDQTLLANLRAEPVRGATRALERRWRQVTVLRHDAEAQLYIEAKRVELAEDHIVLAHASIEPLVREYLSHVSGTVMQRLTTTECPSLPRHWTAYLGVRVTGIRDTDQHELQALVPIASTSILLEGGLSLPGRALWHASHPPVARVISLSADKLHVRLSALPSSTREETPPDRDLGECQRSGAWALSEFSLSCGEYRVLVTRKAARTEGHAIASTRVRLVSADKPREGRGRPLGRVPGVGTWPLSATEIVDAHSGPLIQGGWIHDWPAAAPQAIEAELLIPERLSAGLEEIPREAMEERAVESPSAVGSDDAPICATRAHHYWVLPATGPETAWHQEQVGHCKDCGLERWFSPTRGRGRGSPSAAHFQHRVAPAIPLLPAESAIPVTPDELLDALTYLQGGERREIASLLEPVSSSALLPDELMRLLSALGHVELELDEDCSQIIRWWIAPPTLMELTPGTAILTGARSARFLERLGADVEALGGTLCRDAQADAPARLRVMSLDRKSLLDVAESVREATGQALHVVTDGAMQLAQSLPPLLTMAAHLTREPWPQSRAERFELATYCWVGVDRPREIGAYRFGSMPRRYGFIDAAGLMHREMARADYRTVKHLAAMRLGRGLLAHSAAARALQVPLGAELPGLYERAVVLASGLAPMRRVDGVVHYRDVPRLLAQETAYRLSEARLAPAPEAV